MIHKLWTYRFVIYNLLFAVYFLLLSPYLKDASYQVFYEDQGSLIVAICTFSALVFELLGLYFKTSALQQLAGVSQIFKGNAIYKIAIGGTLTFGILGRLIYGFFLMSMGMAALYGDQNPPEIVRNLLIGLALAQLFAFMYLLFGRGLEKSPKQYYSLNNPPTHFMIKDAIGDLSLLLFSGLSFTIVWQTLIYNPNFTPISSLPESKFYTESFFAIIFFLLMYMPANLVHFILHTNHIQSEKRLERLLYWISWVITMFLAIWPMF